MTTINYQELQNVAKALNEACGTGLKVIGGKKEDLKKGVKSAVENGLDNLPEAVTLFYNEFLKDSEATKIGNTIEVLTSIASKIGVHPEAEMSPSSLEALIFETLDGMTEAEWNALDEEARAWDVEMTRRLKAAAEKDSKKDAGEDSKKGAGEDTETGKDQKEGKEKESKDADKKPAEPRPDFEFSKNTNAYHIVQIFKGLFERSKGEGIKIDDLKAACVDAKVKSNNIPGRVTAVINYAALPEGGEQIKKANGLLYPKGHLIEE